MAGNPGIDIIKKAAAAKRNAGGAVANALKNAPPKGSGKGAPSMSNAIARRLAKRQAPSDNDGDEHEYRD